MTGQRPNFYGLVLTDRSKKAIRIGKLAVWKQTVPPATKRPPFTGNIEINGQKYAVALWENIEV